MANGKRGKKYYWYTVRGGKLDVSTGVVMTFYDQQLVMFDSSNRASIPREDIIGVVQDGFSLWLTERNDVLARDLFMNYAKAEIFRHETKVKLLTKTLRKLEEIEL